MKNTKITKTILLLLTFTFIISVNVFANTKSDMINNAFKQYLDKYTMDETVLTLTTLNDKYKSKALSLLSKYICSNPDYGYARAERFTKYCSMMDDATLQYLDNKDSNKLYLAFDNYLDWFSDKDLTYFIFTKYRKNSTARTILFDAYIQYRSSSEESFLKRNNKHYDDEKLFLKTIKKYLNSYK